MQNRVNLSLEPREQGAGRGAGLEEGGPGPRAHLPVERSGLQKYVPINVA